MTSLPALLYPNNPDVEVVPVFVNFNAELAVPVILPIIIVLLANDNALSDFTAIFPFKYTLLV